MEQQKQKTKIVALGGVMLALSITTIFLAGLIPGVELTLYALSSFYTAVIIIETKAGGGWIFYIASCLLSLVMIPNKTALLPYIIFFGIYGLAKYYIEKIRNQVIEVILKLLFFNSSFGLGIYFFKDLLLGNIHMPDYPQLILIAGAELMFLLYDAIFTMLIAFYNKRLRRV